MTVIFHRLAAGLSAVSLLQACAYIVPPAELSPAHPAGRIQVINGETFLPHRLVESLTTQSCLESPDDVVEARNKMMKMAHNHGADAVVKYRCQTVKSRSIPEGTVQCRKCTGDAIKWK